MPLDPGIFNYNPAPIEPPVNALLRGLQLQHMQRQNALQDMQLQQERQAQEQRAQENALRQRFATPENRPGDGIGPTQDAGFNFGGYANALAAVDPMRALQLKSSLQKEQPKLMNVGAGGAIFDPATKREIYRAPFKPDAQSLPDIAKLQAYAATLPPGDPRRAQVDAAITKMTTHPAGVSVSYGAPVAGQDAQGNPVFFQPDKGGGKPAIIPGVAPPAKEEKPLTEGQAKAVLFSSRMQAADKIMADLAKSGTNVSIPGATRNNVIGDVITAASPAAQQQLVQAKRDFVNAVLRRESGAVISPEEFANAERQYFPQVGDSAQVIEQKSRNRKSAIAGMRADVPQGRQGEVDAIAGGANKAPAVTDFTGFKIIKRSP